MKPLEMKDDAFLRLAKEEDNCSIGAGSLEGVFQKKEGAATDATVGEDERKAS
jgi:hypothetical protein